MTVESNAALSDLVTREDMGAIALLTLNAPSALNVLSDAMLAALQSHLDALKTDTSIKVVILAGAGKMFCAGHDLKEMTAARAGTDGGKSYFAELFRVCSHLMKSIQTLPQPVIAQVQGGAVAAGCQLVASCDLAVAETGAKFGVNGVNIGLFCSTPMVALSRNIARKKAFEMLTTGRLISASEAQEWGLLNRITDPAALEQATLEMANVIASKLSAAVKIGKEAFYTQLDMPLQEAYDFTGKVMTENMMLDDTSEGIRAFLEKRPPNWQQ